MDTLLALGVEIIMNETSQMNPLYPIPGENRPILTTGLTTSMASEEWFHDKTDTVAINYNGPPYHSRPGNKKKTINIVGKAKYPLPRNPTFCILIAKIPAWLSTCQPGTTCHINPVRLATLTCPDCPRHPEMTRKDEPLCSRRAESLPNI
jgi:hypothetical protein